MELYKTKGINLEVIIAVGHTDSDGGDAFNQKLSVRRAEAVKAYLTGKGVKAENLKAKGYRVLAINPRVDSIGRNPVYPSLEALPELVIRLGRQVDAELRLQASSVRVSEMN